MNDMNTLDITPTPRILRTLGEIPFQTWQCVDSQLNLYRQRKKLLLRRFKSMLKESYKKHAN